MTKQRSHETKVELNETKQKNQSFKTGNIAGIKMIYCSNIS